MKSLARLTSLSTQTLSLLLERQRLQTLASNSSTSLHGPQIAKNLEQLRAGIVELEQNGAPSEASRLLRQQHERMRGMLGPDADALGVQRCAEPQPDPMPDAPSSFSLATAGPPHTSSSDPHFAPYSDDPEAGYSNGEMLEQQRMIMDDQDVRLDELSRSVSRQHDISLQIGDELDVHTGLLEGLDHDLDHTDTRLRGARRRLGRVAQGAKENGSVLMIGLLILVLFILIIVFKT
ncbi:uncharacterized protein BXZ73DRAFT_104978 [Epithele typhae]|uniref:uncharacterized protein n=1 Tax=Epithele typhae TaxID=378194 RepID=UPI00200747AE|nr:uncharacterized protein BXZ73DRAFT_104978 [Epithele typhae]KAH9919499.1 hypothetical protein BXZ73DRAFT_104978 [Epithele typhae]